MTGMDGMKGLLFLDLVVHENSLNYVFFELCIFLNEYIRLQIYPQKFSYSEIMWKGTGHFPFPQ